MISLHSNLWREGLLVLFCVLTVGAKDRFLLQAKLFTIYASGSQTVVFTGYSYNDSGYRVEENIYNGADSSAAVMSSTVYVYNQDNTLSDVVLKTATGDTVSIVRYGYDSNKRAIAVSTLTKQAIRYVDSMVYDADGHMTAKRRYSGGILNFYNSYSYNAAGKKISDTLHETNGTGFFATQAVIFSYDANGYVLNERNYRFQAAAWYLISTNEMAYSSVGLLVSVTQYEGDGAGNLMQDSLAYAYDNSGNQTRELHYDNDRVLISATDYTWIDTQPVRIDLERISEKSVYRYERGKVLLTDIQGIVHLSLYDARGRLLGQFHHQGAPWCEVALPDLGRGSYIAVISSDHQTSAFHFTTIN